MKITVDDLCLSYLDNFKHFDELKKKVPTLKIIVFTIGNFNNNELLMDSEIFKKWYVVHSDWVEIAVHSYDHQYPPDGDRNDEEYWIKKALDSLKPFLPEEYGYRSPGWQTTNKTIDILKRLGFSYIAYETKIKDLKKNSIINERILNSHLYDLESISKMKEVIENYEVLQN